MLRSVCHIMTVKSEFCQKSNIYGLCLELLYPLSQQAAQMGSAHEGHPILDLLQFFFFFLDVKPLVD